MQTIGQALARTADDQTTVSSTRYVERRPCQTPKTVEECVALDAWAHATAAPPIPVTLYRFTKHLEYMAVTLPAKNVDDLAGEKRTTVYFSLLGHHPEEAIAYLVRKACESLDWFPTPKQCKTILDGYLAPATEQELAIADCRGVMAVLFEDWLAGIRNGEPIGDASERWQRIAIERGALRALDDGTIVNRATFVGPRIVRTLALA